MVNESEILADLGNGDREAFRCLYMFYAPRVELFVSRMVKDRQCAEDITHNIFLKVWENREIISLVGSFRNYLFKMAKNAVLDLFGHRLICNRYRQRVESKRQHYGEAYSLEEEIDADELSAMIDMAVDKMPSRRKSAFILSRHKGLSHKEIAKQMKISSKTVENHIAQALDDIRKAIS